MGSDTNGRSTRSNDGETRVGWRMAGIGFETAAQVAAGVLLGWLFDRWQGTDPTGVLVGGVLGIAVAMWTLIKGTLKLNRDLDAMARTRGRGKPIPYDDETQANHDDVWNADHQPDDNDERPDDGG